MDQTEKILQIFVDISWLVELNADLNVEIHTKCVSII